MKLFLAIILALFALGQQTVTATNISGSISGVQTFTKANSPYVLIGDLVVNEGATLYIEPGTQIRVPGGANFFVDGTIRAIGTAADPIIFKPTAANPDRSSWIGVNMRYTTSLPDSNVFEYCHFSNAIKGIAVDFGKAHISHCVFSECAVAVDAFNNSGGDVVVADNVIKHCDNGIKVFDGATIERNELAHINYFGISAAFGSKVNDNWVHDSHTGIFGGAEIVNNTAANCSTGFILTGVQPVSGNLAVYNIVGYELRRVGMQNNAAIHNKTGVIAIVDQGQTLAFSNNCIDSNYEYNLKTQGWGTINATNNYWGTTDLNTIQGRVLDRNDDSLLPVAALLPALTGAPSGCRSYTGPVVTNVAETKNKPVQLVVSPNPFSDRFAIELQGKANKLEVFNMAGQRVYSADVTNKNKMEVDMSAYPAGVYHYRAALVDNSIVSGKLVKQ